MRRRGIFTVVQRCYNELRSNKKPRNELHVKCHYCDVTMGRIASQITSLTIVYSIVYSDADQRKHQSSASLAFVWGIHRGLVNSPHKWPVTRKMFPFDDVIMVIFPGCMRNTWFVCRKSCRQRTRNSIYLPQADYYS